MTDSAPADTPVAIERVDRARGEGIGIRLRLTGRWLGPGNPADVDPLLVVTIDRRRHRFPAIRAAETDDRPAAAVWEATFELPAWADPTRAGQASLWLGGSVVPVPPAGTPVAEAAPPPLVQVPPPPAALPPGAPASLPGGRADHPGPVSAPLHTRLPAPPGLGEASPWPPQSWPPPPPAAPAAPGSGAPPAGQPEPLVDTGRTGPLAELLFRESVSALHAELDQRASEAARLRGQLADARAELESRTAKQVSLESAHADLRTQLQQLMEAASDQRQGFERRLSELQERLSAAAARQAEADRGRTAAEQERDRARTELEQERGRAATELEQERSRGAAGLEEERARAAEQVAAAVAERDAHAAHAAELHDQLSRFAAGQQRHASELVTLREQLATASVAREAAAGEVAGLQAQLQRLGSELAVTREQLEARGGDLGEAQRLLADARALTEQLRGETSQ